MFSALKTNDSIFVLRKTDEPELSRALVLEVKNMAVPFTPIGNDIELRLKIGDDERTFRKIPGNQSVAADDNMIFAETQEQMAFEVDSWMKQIQKHLDSKAVYENIVHKCSGFLETLDPKIAKEKKNQERMDSMELKITGIESSLADIRDMVSRALQNK